MHPRFLFLSLLSISAFSLAACSNNTSAVDMNESESSSLPYAVSTIEKLPIALTVARWPIGNASAVTLASYARGDKNFMLPILMYHYIQPMPGPKDKLGQGLTVTPATFASQLDIIAQKGYHTINFADLADTGASLPSKPLILTFDDGYQDAYDTVFPILKARHMKAVFYIVSGFPGKPNYATWDELTQMTASGMEMGAHTFNHFDLAKMTMAQQEKEIAGSKETIEQTLGIHIVSLAYPSGRYNKDSLIVDKKAAIAFAVTTHPGIAKSVSNTLELPRLRMTEKTQLQKIL